ncbi:hypothetical protein D9758_013558 [Tetrapyrgos nigripes]|uniref:Uncharacterized protein n=1 Tax=Tetrapyrgos nigripes TaxID=182062 RepID=A0A8H5FKZ2_9AGAR|nr:hypothetical protein D9758_013558 [Tetrapyrgos nigripes]
MWCGLCHTCNILQFEEPGPEVVTFYEGRGLPRHYSETLAPLQHLQSVHFTVQKRTPGKISLLSGVAAKDTFWHGECSSCMEMVYNDETFYQDWTMKKQKFLDDPEKPKPPRLEKVEWVFRKLLDDPGDNHLSDLEDISDDEEEIE